MAVAFPQIRIGEPLRHKALSVFPLFSESTHAVEYLLADEAIRDQMLTVEEISEGGSVPELLVDNKADIRVLFIEGEELVGAKQNRILNTSLPCRIKLNTGNCRKNIDTDRFASHTKKRARFRKVSES